MNNLSNIDAWGFNAIKLTIVCLASYLLLWKLRSCVILWSPPFSRLLRVIFMSNSPHPSSDIRKGGMSLTMYFCEPSQSSLDSVRNRTLLRTVSKRFMKQVCNFAKYVGRDVFIMLVDQEDLNGPSSHGIAFHD